MWPSLQSGNHGTSAMLGVSCSLDGSSGVECLPAWNQKGWLFSLLTLFFLFYFLLIHLFCVWAYLHMPRSLCRRQVTTCHSSLLWIHGFLVKLRLLGLVAIAFICWALLLALIFMCYFETGFLLNFPGWPGSLVCYHVWFIYYFTCVFMRVLACGDHRTTLSIVSQAWFG